MAKKLRIEAIFKAIDKVTAPLRRMQNRVQRFSRSVKRSLRSVDRVTSKIARGLAVGIRRGAAIAAAAIGTVAFATKTMADDLDALAKASRRMNFPIEELQEWRFVAEQSGLTSEEFNKSIGKFAKTLGEARSGFGTMFENLKRMDRAFFKQITTTDDTAKAFGMFLQKIRETPNTLDKAALATTAFGRSGLKLINIADTSAEKIAQLRDEQRDNGVVTMTQAKAAEDLNDSMNSLQRSIGGLLQSALVPLLPMMTRGVDALRAWVIVNKEVIATGVQEFVQKIIDNFQDIVKWTKRIAIGFAVFVTFAGTIKILIGVMELLNIVMAANPIGLIVLGVIALGAMLAAAFAWGKKIKAVFDELPFPIKVMIGLLVIMSGPFALILAAVVLLRVHFEKVKQVALVVFKAIALAALAASDVIESAWSPVEEFFISLWNGVIDVFEKAINFIVNTGPISFLIAAVLIIKRNWTLITIVFAGIWALVKATFNTAVQAIVDGPIALISDAVNFIVDNWGVVGIFFQALWAIVSQVFSDAIDFIINSGPLQWLIGGVEKTESAWRPIVDFFIGIWGRIAGVFETAVNKITAIASPIIEAFKKIQKARDKIIGEEIGEIKLGGRIRRETEDTKTNLVHVDFKQRQRLPEILVPIVGGRMRQRTGDVGGSITDLTRVLKERDADKPVSGLADIIRALRERDADKPVSGLADIIRALRERDAEDREGDASVKAFQKQTVGAEAQVVRMLQEQRISEKAEITIRDETGRAEVTKGSLGHNIKLEKTGSF